jgi:hypothetical protein
MLKRFQKKRVLYGVNWMELVRVRHKDGFSHMHSVAWDGNSVDTGKLGQTK